MPNLDVDRLIQGWRGPLIAALVALFAGLPGMLAVPVVDRDEARFSQATAQMLETGDYVNIQLQDTPRHKKPVGIHWLQAAAVATVSNSEARQIWAYRIPSLLGVMAAAAACAWGALAFFGARGGVLAGVAFGSTILLSTEANFAKTDAALTAFVTLAMAALGRLYFASKGGPPAGRRIKLVFWIAMAGAVLIKGPVGPMVAALSLLFLAVADRGVEWMKRIGWLWGVVIILAVVGPWAIAITVATDGAFWGAAIGHDFAGKLSGAAERHGGLPGYHLLGLPLWFFPASLLLGAAVWTGWTRREEPGVRFALAWLIPSFIVFELAPTKLPHYPLPVYGALAWLVAAAIEKPIPLPARWVGVGLSALGAALLSVLTLLLLRRFGDPGDVVWVSLTIGFAVIGTAVAAFFLLHRASVTALLIACGFGILAHTAFTAGVAPNLKPFWVSRNLAKTLRAHNLDPRQGAVPGPVEIAGFSEPSAVFLLGTDTGLGGPADAADAIGGGRPAVVEAKLDKDFRAELAKRGLHARAAATVKGFNYARGKWVTLTVYQTTGAAQGAPS